VPRLGTQQAMAGKNRLLFILRPYERLFKQGVDNTQWLSYIINTKKGPAEGALLGDRSSVYVL